MTSGVLWQGQGPGREEYLVGGGRRGQLRLSFFPHKDSPSSSRVCFIYLGRISCGSALIIPVSSVLLHPATTNGNSHYPANYPDGLLRLEVAGQSWGPRDL
jgi:hypothetical protein